MTVSVIQSLIGNISHDRVRKDFAEFHLRRFYVKPVFKSPVKLIARLLAEKSNKVGLEGTNKPRLIFPASREQSRRIRPEQPTSGISGARLEQPDCLA